MKKLVIGSCIALVFAAFCGSLPSLAAQATGAPIEINAILSLTGGASFIGAKEVETLNVLERMINDDGGVRGRPIKFVIRDDASTPQVAVQLLNTIAGQRPGVFLGSGVAPTCSAIEPIVDRGGVVSYCLSPVVRPTAGSYMFSTDVGTIEYLPLTMHYLKSRGWTRIALMTATDASGRDYETAFDEMLAKADAAGLQLVAREHFANQDLSVAAQMSRIKAASPQVLVTFSTGTAFATILHGANDVGLSIPTFASAANLSHTQLAQYRSFAPPRLYFAAGGGVVLDPKPGKQHDAQLVFFNAFKPTNIQPEFLHTLAWDPGLIVVDALRRLGPDASGAQIRRYISEIHGFQGITGTYDFRKYPQRGLGPSSSVIYSWEPRTDSLTVVPFHE